MTHGSTKLKFDPFSQFLYSVLFLFSFTELISGEHYLFGIYNQFFDILFLWEALFIHSDYIFNSCTVLRASWVAWRLRVGKTCYPETSVSNYHPTLCNVPEERRSHWHRGDSLNSSTVKVALRVRVNSRESSREHLAKTFRRESKSWLAGSLRSLLRAPGLRDLSDYELSVYSLE